MSSPWRVRRCDRQDDSRLLCCVSSGLPRGSPRSVHWGAGCFGVLAAGEPEAGQEGEGLGAGWPRQGRYVT